VDFNYTVVIPTYNEAENLPKMADALFALPVPNLGLLVVDDNSPDGTGRIGRDLNKQYPGRVDVLQRPGKQGLGTAYLAGFRHALNAGAAVVVQMDADFSHPPEKLPEFFSALEDADVVFGSRYVPGGRLDERWPVWRKWLSGFANFYAKTILRIPVHDITGGYRAWKRDALLGIPMQEVRSNGYAFQVEMAYLAYRLGCKIKEVPIYFADRQLGQSKMSFKVQYEAAVRVWQMLVQYRHIKPK
jgi:dolichol-phosphate mannosyltransferase